MAWHRGHHHGFRRVRNRAICRIGGSHGPLVASETRCRARYCFDVSLGRFSAAGALLMLATVAFASLATWRSDWHQWLRLLLAMAAVPLIVYVANDIGHDKVWNPMTVARIALSSSSTPQSSLPRGQPSRRSPTDGGPGEFYAPSVSAFLDFS